MVLSWVFVVLVLSVGLAEENCPKHPLAGYYKEIGCVPKFENGSTCATSYDCTLDKKGDLSVCIYNGKNYTHRQAITDLAGGSCLASCYCDALNGEPKIECAQVECPEVFGYKPPENCRNVYSHDNCCSTGHVCEPTKVTCTYANKTVLEGEKFYPEASCKRCICMKDFQGKLEEPFCRESMCNVQVHYSSEINRGCAPVYYGADGCCPIAWKCPEESDAVSKGHTKTGPVCKFGSLVLQPGDKLQHSAKNIDCVCDLPPYLTCIMKR